MTALAWQYHHEVLCQEEGQSKITSNGAVLRGIPNHLSDAVANRAKAGNKAP